MTNERWRAEIPASYSGICDYSQRVFLILTRANAELDAAEAEKAALTKELDELAHNLEAEREENDRTISALICRAQDAEFRRNDAESELAARRASDEDVRECAESMRFYRPGAPEAASRLLAADWLKKEGGS